MAIERRVSRLEGAYEQLDARLGDMQRSIDSLRSEINSRFNTMYILLGASWVTMIGAMIGLYFR